MRPKILFILLLFASGSLVFGQKYTTKTGTLKFEASVPSFEEVAGENKTVSAVLEAEKGNIAVLALVKGFRFKIALMEEHFNENYAESDQFPKATFSGKIAGFDVKDLTSTAKNYTLSGDLTFHGKTKKVSSTAKMSKSGDKISVSGHFELKPEDFGMEIPGAVRNKVAKTVEVSYQFLLSK